MYSAELKKIVEAFSLENMLPRPLLGEKMVVCNKLRWYAVRTASSGYGVRCQLLVSERGEAWL